MLSGASATGHEIGGTLGIAIYASIATAASGGLSGPRSGGHRHAFLIAAHVAPGRHRALSCCPPPVVPAQAAAQPAGDRRPLSTRSGVTSTPPAPVTPGAGDLADRSAASGDETAAAAPKRTVHAVVSICEGLASTSGVAEGPRTPPQAGPSASALHGKRKPRRASAAQAAYGSRHRHRLPFLNAHFETVWRSRRSRSGCESGRRHLAGVRDRPLRPSRSLPWPRYANASRSRK